jgi:tetratricopeptide (TPR) repeat protein
MPNYQRLLLLCIALLALYTRFVGIDRSESDFAPPEKALEEGLTAYSHHFHPDEETLVRAALALEDPLDPPLTAYGMLPLYVWRATLALYGPLADAPLDTLDTVASTAAIYRAIRLLSILFSLASLALVWHLGKRLYGPGTAALAALFFVAVPALIQAAHFATVDGLHTLLCLAAFALMLRAFANERWLHYALAGLVIGAAGAVRLNGLLLGPVLVAGHIAAHGWTAWRRPGIWVAGLAALLALILLQPYLLFDPALLTRAEGTDDLGFSLKVAQGEILRPWTVADLHTIPYLHYATDLLPLAVGWPLALGILAGLIFALWKRRHASLLPLIFCGLYFLQMGGLHTKHVRYLLPMLPFLLLLAADFCFQLKRVRPRAGLALGGVLAIAALVYGLAFSSIYTREDSRIQAARWIVKNVPEGTTVAGERGGFSMDPLVRSLRRPTRLLNTATLFESRGYMTCSAALSYLRNRLLGVEYIALVDVNRYQQFSAAPDRMPATAAFYRSLVAGELGYSLIERFKNDPVFGPFTFADEGSEPSFTGYDHPAVYVLKRRDEEKVNRAFAGLEEQLQQDPYCPDTILHRVAEQFQANDLEGALQTLTELRHDQPHLALNHLIEAEIQQRLDHPGLEQDARDRFKQAHTHRAAHVLPWAAGMGLMDLGLEVLADAALTEGALKSQEFPRWAAREMAQAYALLANNAYDQERRDLAWNIYFLSSNIEPNIPAYNRLAFMAFRRQDYRLSVEFWGRSVRLNDDQAGIHSNLGQVYLQHQNNAERALAHLVRAQQLDPRSAAELAPWIARAKELIQR